MRVNLSKEDGCTVASASRQMPLGRHSSSSIVSVSDPSSGTIYYPRKNKKILYGKVLQYAELFLDEVSEMLFWNLDSTVLFILHLV
jgi:hypothetical protein